MSPASGSDFRLFPVLIEICLAYLAAWLLNRYAKSVTLSYGILVQNAEIDGIFTIGINTSTLVWCLANCK